MNFVKFDELTVNLDRVAAYRLRQNKNDGSFRNKEDYPYVAELYGGGEKPFTIHLTEKMMAEFKQLISAKDLTGGRGGYHGA
ncbi:MAG: hypothetical protein LBQ48_08455 [Oscillospiraceae bacterium]|jgi:hypothetical protein|nr:hypothetical protein [Oscillospiraceae bacterium]